MADASFDQILSGSLTQDLSLSGLDDMKLDLTLDGGTTTTLAGETTVNTDSTVTLEPVTTTSTVTLEPVTTTSTVDLEPVSVDSCVRVELAPAPPTEVSTPYEQRWAVSLLGVELFALCLSGRTVTEVRPLPRRPQVFELEHHHEHPDRNHDRQGPVVSVRL
jgi:hypothetical protein